MQNNFFGSKLNTVLLLILIILLGVTIWVIKENKIFEPQDAPIQEAQNQNIEINDKSTKPIVVEDKSKVQPFSFLKDIVFEYPDSVIKECNFSGEKYFSVNPDRVENGSHIYGASESWYSEDGSLVGSCSTNPYAGNPEICNKSMLLCKTVYSSSKSFLGTSIDKYKLR